MERTVKIYDTDSHVKDFSAEVLFCEKSENGEKYEIILDRTAFFPGGGGQAPDNGFLYYDGKKIKTVGGENVKKYGPYIVVHIADEPIAAGTAVTGTINYAERFSLMQNHSGEHIISGLANSMYGCNNVGFHMGEDFITVDFDVKLDGEQLAVLEKKANDVVYENRPISVKYYSSDELSELQFRAKKSFDTDVRIVTIENCDSCACCAPHVGFTGEIGIIKIFDKINYKGGVRLFILSGGRAFDYITKLNENTVSASNILSVKPFEISVGLEKLNAEISELKQKLRQLNSMLINRIASSVEETEKPVVLYQPEFDTNTLRELVNAVLPKTKALCVALSGGKNGIFNYVIASDSLDMKAEGKNINSALNGNGGGSKQMITGRVNSSEIEIRSYFNENY